MAKVEKQNRNLLEEKSLKWHRMTEAKIDILAGLPKSTQINNNAEIPNLKSLFPREKSKLSKAIKELVTKIKVRLAQASSARPRGPGMAFEAIFFTKPDF